jgi:hypothetical protein
MVSGPGGTTIQARSNSSQGSRSHVNLHSARILPAHIPSVFPDPALFQFISVCGPACFCWPTTRAAAVDADRWMEINLYWFKEKAIPDSVHQFWERFEPLYRGVRGYRRVILNIG